MALTFTPFPDLGNPCPEFKLPATDGQTYSLQNFPEGSPLVIMFICNHCPYVQAIEDRLIQLGQDLKKQNVPVVAICSNDAKSHPEDSFENLKKRAEAKGYPFVYLYDETQEIAHKFGAVCTPDFFVYDKAHKLAYRGRLDDSWKDANKVTKRELYEAVQTLLKDQKVSEEQTASMGCSIKWI
ncbi:MAG: alkyl hydroperoxide reductase [Bdellovibrio sp. ArHS]|uniref:thioredoxin family protein n=1 Tax=Bdellovibrio sp. ArHS TaxID=1569284 RepID=UPI000583E154|nr:thioredoxin family protein [Bdellovibrio sp. ArHS]KHD88297.1 MAG: alkyl hydroperoxide reductase [Bdellovibrio sp. ArHS]